MNHIFNKQLCKFVLLFDDILNTIYEEHLRHLDELLGIMESPSLFVKSSKCRFEVLEILYLGHIISTQGVQVH